MERIASRAQAVTAFLTAHEPAELRARLAGLRAGDEDDDDAARRARERAADAIQEQLRVGEALDAELRRFRAEMEHLIASLGVVHGQLVRISVSFDPQLQEDVAREVRDLRTRVGTLADGLRDATDEVKDQA
jgi:outer membrane translocation and assembly module TamA